MKAITLKEPGGIENLMVETLEVPAPRENEVLIEVRALSINPVDVKTRKGGALYGSMKEQPPVILGWDISGVVTSIGSSVNKFKIGDEVFGMVNFPGHGQGYAEYVTASAEQLALKPGNITHQHAAVATLAALTALQVLVYEASIQKGQHVLIHAAAGGVGHFAVQIAKHLGAEVTGTASSRNAAFLKELGVDNHIDYTKVAFYERVNGVDIVLDPIGGETTAQSLEVLRPGGVLVSIVGGVKEHLAGIVTERGISAKNYLVHSSGSDMEQLAVLLSNGTVKPFVSQVYSFEEMAEAHLQIETGRTRGKLVIEVSNTNQ